jgi:ubiquitin carboxyl-terminal hydrolase 5/13
MDELNLAYNLSINWSKVFEKDGKEAALIYGPGFCGFKNLGNSCYMASSLQVLYSLPTFQARYLGEGREHLAKCTQNRPGLFL